MKTPGDIFNLTSAADTAIGFDYQFYYFLYLILGLGHGEKIGFEVKDDIHIELPDGETILIQTKHTVQQKADGSNINLTERDKDLWKTLSNWVNILSHQPDKNEFLQKTTFQLVSNKSASSNRFLEKLEEVASGRITIADFKSYLRDLKKSTTDNTVAGYIKILISVPNALLTSFIKKISFELDEDDLIQRIKKRLLEQIRIAERIDDVYLALQSSIRDQNYLTIKRGEKIEVSFQDFIQRFRHCFKKGYTDSLPIRDFNIKLPDNPLNQRFIKQLLDIDALAELDTEEIIELTTYMLMIYNNLEQWEKDGELGLKEAKKFEDNTILLWKNSFKSKYREIKRRHGSGESLDDLEEEIQQAAVQCLDELRKATLTIEETALDLQLSNGYFYLLTEDGNIGWHFDWQNRYKV